MRQTAIGLNFIDVYFRDGSYSLDLPAGLGAEAAGVVEGGRRGRDRIQGRRPRRLRWLGAWRLCDPPADAGCTPRAHSAVRK